MAATMALAGFFSLLPDARADSAPLLEVQIDAVDPAVIDPSDKDQVVEISGTVRNASDVDMRYVNVHFWRSDQGLNTVEEIDAAVAAPLTAPLGARLNNPEAGNLDLLTDDTPFSPGATAEFTVRGTVGQLALPNDAEAVYRLGVHVRAVPDGGANTTAGRARVLVPARASMPQVSATVLLSSRPVLVTNATIADAEAAEHLAGELTGRLDALLASAERPGVVGLIDPALYDAVRVLAEQRPAPGTADDGAKAAASWILRVDALAEEGRLWRLPPGDPDLAKADATGRRELVTAPTTENVESPETPETPLADLPTVAVLEETGSEHLAGALTGFDHIVARQARGSAGTVIEGRSLTLPEPLEQATPAERTGYLLATEAVSGDALTYLLTDERQAALEGSLDEQREHVAPGTASSAAVSWLPAQEAAPWSALATRLDTLDLTWELAGRETEGRFAAEAFNRNFTTEAEALAWVDSSPIGRFDPKRIAVVAARQFVMSSSTGTFPVTVSNGTELPVTVRLHFRSDLPQRISVPDPDPVSLQPGQSHTLSIAPEAAANGVTLVHGQLVTEAGRTFGTETTIEISATSFGRVGWIIIVVSGVVVLGGTALRIRAVRAEENHESRQQR